MLRVDEQVVTEYLEQNGFLVRALRKSRIQSKKAVDEGMDLYARNIAYRTGARSPNFMLFSSELRYVESVLVCVRGWYTEKAAVASMSSGTDVLRYLETNVIKKVGKWFEVDKHVDFGTQSPPLKILVAPVFPAQEPHRSQCVELLKGKGVDGILSFKSMLLDLIDRVDTRQVYEKSALIQTLRTLKTFDLVKDSQMDLLS